MRRVLASMLLLMASPVLGADGGGALVVGAPRGALGQQASVAGGLAGHALFPARSAVLSLRVEGSFLVYGSETVRLPVPRTAGRIDREVTTDNSIAQIGIGPQLVLPFPGVRPYLHAFAGVTYLSTTSRLRDPDGFVSATSTNYDDTGVAYGGGGGLLVPLHGRGASLDLGVRYVRTGSVRFLAEGDLAPAAGGVSALPHRGRADVLEFRLGLAFGERAHSR